MNPFSLVGLIILGLILLCILYWRLWFCRKPVRLIPKDPKLILSPANGRVAVVKQVAVKATAKKWNRGSVEILCKDVAPECWFILIVMTPWHVHYQRAPVKGIIEKITYTPGKFKNAVNNAEQLLTLENERNEITIKGKRGKVKVVQIAGLLARRINCFAKEGEKVDKGGELGFINLGSQVALILPKQVKVHVQPGDAVVDGESIIGEY